VAEIRKGTVRIVDADVHVWEDGVDEAALKRAVFDPLIRHLRMLGWSVRRDEHVHKRYRRLSKWHRYCRRGDLEAKLSLSGRHIGFNMFQNIANVENHHGGEYDFDRIERMPYLLRKRAELTIAQLTSHLQGMHGYGLSRPLGLPRPGGMTAREWIDAKIRECDWHYKPHLGRADWHGNYNRESADGALLDHGQEVHFFDSRTGRLVRGRAFYNINNMWWVEYGPWSWTNKACFELFAARPADLRAKCPRRRKDRLQRDLKSAVEAMRFERAAVFRDLLGLKEAA
jgi:hypothetical protein